MKTNRKFGIELETVGLNHHALEDAIRRSGVAAQAEDYNHSARRYWKIVPDGSLHAQNGGAGEVVSPPMHSIDEVRTVCRALVSGGATVNRSCGLHVHFDAHDIGDGPDGALAWKVLLSSYVCAEPEVDALMPMSRRGNANSYCKSMIGTGSRLDASARATKVESIWAARNLSQMVNIYNGDRYWKVNLMPFTRQGTVEFRQHAGSVNHEKVANWILLLETLMNHAVRAAEAIRTGAVQEDDVRRKLRESVWYSSTGQGAPSVDRFMAVLAPSYPHAVAAPLGSTMAPAVEAANSVDWRTTLNAQTFRPVRISTNGGDAAPRTRAVAILNANPTLRWAELIGLIVEQTGMTPGNANMMFARWNKKLREREAGVAARRAPAAVAARADAPAPLWNEIAEFYSERAMELAGATL